MCMCVCVLLLFSALYACYASYTILFNYTTWYKIYLFVFCNYIYMHIHITLLLLLLLFLLFLQFRSEEQESISRSRLRLLLQGSKTLAEKGLTVHTYAQGFDFDNESDQAESMVDASPIFLVLTRAKPLIMLLLLLLVVVMNRKILIINS